MHDAPPLPLHPPASILQILSGLIWSSPRSQLLVSFNTVFFAEITIFDLVWMWYIALLLFSFEDDGGMQSNDVACACPMQDGWKDARNIPDPVCQRLPKTTVPTADVL